MPKRIHGQVSQSKIGKSAEHVGVVANVLIAARDKLVGVPAGWCRTQVIIYRTGDRWPRVVFRHILLPALLNSVAGNYVFRIRRSISRCRVDAVRVVDLICGVIRHTSSRQYRRIQDA